MYVKLSNVALIYYMVINLHFCSLKKKKKSVSSYHIFSVACLNPVSQLISFSLRQGSEHQFDIKHTLYALFGGVLLCGRP